jgi:transcriptional regulator with XRE-family HTH domain
MSVGGRIRELREARNVSQMVLAERLGMASNGHLSAIESGKVRARPAMLARIADALDVPTSELTGDVTGQAVIDTATAYVEALGDGLVPLDGKHYHALRMAVLRHVGDVL